jgi:hypothetical protein
MRERLPPSVRGRSAWQCPSDGMAGGGQAWARAYRNRSGEGPLIRRQKRDDDLPRVAALASQSVFHLGQRETIAQVRSQFHQ